MKLLCIRRALIELKTKLQNQLEVKALQGLGHQNSLNSIYNAHCLGELPLKMRRGRPYWCILSNEYVTYTA